MMNLEPLEHRIAPAAVVFDHSSSSDGSPDELLLERVGNQLTLSINGTLAQSWAFSEVDSISIMGSSDDDTLTLALGAGDLLPAGGLDFDGGAGFDTLALGGGGDGVRESHLAYDEHSGVITLNGREVRYRAIEPVVDTVPATNFIFTAPDNSGTINLLNAGSGQVTISSPTGAFESITFSNKTNVTINGGAGANMITVSSTAANGLATLTLQGGGDNAVDTLIVGASTVLTTLEGGGGDDLFIVGNGVTLNGGSIVGGAGINTLDLSSYLTPVVVNLATGNSTIGSVAGIVDVIGGSGDDLLTGSNLANKLRGGPGRDTLIGGQGGDQLFGEAGDDLLVWNNGDGSDLMEGGADHDTVQVNGSATAADQFLLQVNSSDPTRLRFDRTNLGLFNLNIGTTEKVELNPLDGLDTTTLEFANGNPIPADGVDLNGGDGGARLILQRSSGSFVASAEFHTSSNGDSGAILVDGKVLTYGKVLRVDDLLPASNLTFHAPPVAQVLNFDDSPGITGAAQISSPAGAFAPVDFSFKTNVTIQGTADADLITLNSAITPLGLFNLVIDAGAGADTINVINVTANHDVELDGGDDADLFKVAPAIFGAIHVNGGSPGGRPGDILRVETNGFPAQLGEGVVDFTGLGDVFFTGIEDVSLSNHTLRLLNPHTATYTDQDGDLVTIKTTRGTLGLEDFQLIPNAAGDGAQLRIINLNPAAGNFTGTDLKITAKRTALGGDGFADIGYINASGVDLGNVSIAGDLGAIDAGNMAKAAPAVKSLRVQSLGLFGTLTGAPDLKSEFVGNVPLLAARTDIIGVEITLGTTPLEVGRLGNLSIGGSLRGTGSANTGSIFAASDIGFAKIGGDIAGGLGDFSGSLQAGGNIVRLELGGSIIGGVAGTGSGQVNCSGSLGSVLVRGNIEGGGGQRSGEISCDANAKSIIIRGSIMGGDGLQSGRIEMNGTAAFISISGNIMSGSNFESGSVTAGKIGRMRLGGSLLGGAAALSGSIRSDHSIDSLTIHGSVVGEFLRPAVISAVGESAPTATRDLAIKSLVIDGRVESASIQAGYARAGFGVNADAQIGTVRVKGDWIASNLVAGVSAVSGGFADGDDAPIDEFGITGSADSPTIASRIASIVIGGRVLGTPSSAGDHYGFVAQQIGSFISGSARVALHAAPPLDVVELGGSGDVTLREL